MGRSGHWGQVVWLLNSFSYLSQLGDRQGSKVLEVLVTEYICPLPSFHLQSSNVAWLPLVLPRLVLFTLPSLTKWKLIFNSPKWKSMALLASPSNARDINLSSGPARGSNSFSHLAWRPPAWREEVAQLFASTGSWAQLPSAGEAGIRSIWSPGDRQDYHWNQEMLGQLQRESLNPQGKFHGNCWEWDIPLVPLPCSLLILVTYQSLAPY